MRRTASAWTIGLAAAAAAVFAATEPVQYSAANGERTFKTYCASCHGVSGTGDGYIADTLRKSPTDLTRLAAKNGGQFPEAKVWAVVDGQEEVKSHGKREMPVWGDVFLWPEGDTPERREVVKRKLGELVAHLKTMQKAAEARN